MRLIRGDCLKALPGLPSGSIDLILTDLPYGVTACKWDSQIPLEPLWEQYRRLVKPIGVIALFGAEPFSTRLRSAAPDLYKYDWVQEYTGYPDDILEFPKDPGNLHPSQKPVALLEYLIRTYTDPGGTVLDSCMGSGSTGVACINTGREFIGIEMDGDYYGVACRRIREAEQAKEEAGRQTSFL